MPFLIFVAIAGLGIFLYSSQGGPSVNLPDVDPSEQGGNYKTDYDTIMQSAGQEFGVPFALIKAHSIMESSINPNAFTDENPQQKASRQGWASRGLMQILFWPGSTRLEQFGYTADALNDGDGLFDPNVNCRIAAQLIKQNLGRCNNVLRDAINMYNTGQKEADLEAPGSYVDKVLGYYSTLVKETVS